MEKKKVAIFASGRGSNAKAIVDHSHAKETHYEVALIISNRKEAGVLTWAQYLSIPTTVTSRSTFYDTHDILEILEAHGIDFIVLAGFLLLIPDYLIAAYPDRIVNIHPALLPKYGGKGMYGHHIHKAVKQAKDARSGISIHLVNEEYDEGRIIFQTQCELSKKDTVEDIAARVLRLEHAFYPRIINGIASHLIYSQRN